MRYLFFICMMLMATGCARVKNGEHGYHLVGVDGVYTLTNLHPDHLRKLLYTVNYQQEGFIPLCTRVRIDTYNSSVMRFTLVETGDQYTYRRHNITTKPQQFPAHLDKYFGTRCVKEEVAELSEVDRNGIAQGRILIGMSKKGVLFAVGYPPEHATPILEAGVWRYWTNLFSNFPVYFDADGKVSQIGN